MTITVNGEPLDVEDDATVSDLIARLGLPVDGVAVAVDQRVVPRSQHREHRLPPACKVEIIRAVGGG